MARASAPILVVTGELINVLARAVSGARIGTGAATATLALIAGKALAETTLAVADALVAAFSVVMSLVRAISGIGPRNYERTLALGAIRASPALVAGTFIISAANAVPHAKTRAVRTDRRQCKGSG
jgi:hypothetical protein